MSGFRVAIARVCTERDRLVKAICLSSLIIAITAHAGIVAPPLDFADRTLANGLRVIALEDHSTPTAAIQVWYRVGSKDDPEGRSGFAHLFEHMMFKSTKRMPNETLDRLTEDVGGENNAFTQDDVTAYHETVPSNHLERLVWAEAERLSSLQVDDTNFHTERDVVKEEFRQSVLAKPYGEFGEWIPKMSFTAHPYKRPTIGNIEELDASSLAEVQKFHDTFYRPDNAVLVVAGDFEPADLQRWVDQYFGVIPKPETPIPRVTTKEPPRAGERTLREFSPKVPLPALAVTYLGPAITSEEAPALEVLQQALCNEKTHHFGFTASRCHLYNKPEPIFIKQPAYRLPTEAEWEYAAQAMIGTQWLEEMQTHQRLYPWDGHALRNPYGKQMGYFLANFKRGRGDYGGIAGRLNDGALITSYIYEYPPNDYGLYNMAGNVSEWVMDIYRPLSHQDFDDLNPIRRDDFIDSNDEYRNRYKKEMRDSTISLPDGTAKTIKVATYTKNPQGFISLVSDKVRVYKGGSWKDVAYWMSPGTRRFLDEDSSTATIGFRCAMIRAGSNY